MEHLSLTEQMAKSISERLKKSGYTANRRKVYIGFSKGRGDRTYLHHSRNIIRATKNTKGEEILLSAFGEPNGKSSESQDRRYSSWFFNGYSGKAGSRID